MLIVKNRYGMGKKGGYFRLEMGQRLGPQGRAENPLDRILNSVNPDETAPLGAV